MDLDLGPDVDKRFKLNDWVDRFQGRTFVNIVCGLSTYLLFQSAYQTPECTPPADESLNKMFEQTGPMNCFYAERNCIWLGNYRPLIDRNIYFMSFFHTIVLVFLVAIWRRVQMDSDLLTQDLMERIEKLSMNLNRINTDVVKVAKRFDTNIRELRLRKKVDPVCKNFIIWRVINILHGFSCYASIIILFGSGKTLWPFQIIEMWKSELEYLPTSMYCTYDLQGTSYNSICSNPLNVSNDRALSVLSVCWLAKFVATLFTTAKFIWALKYKKIEFLRDLLDDKRLTDKKINEFSKYIGETGFLLLYMVKLNKGWDIASKLADKLRQNSRIGRMRRIYDIRSIAVFTNCQLCLRK